MGGKNEKRPRLPKVNWSQTETKKMQGIERKEKRKEETKTRVSNPLLKKQLPGREFRAEVIFTTEDALTTEPGLADHSAQSAALVGGALVTEEHCARLDSPLSRVIEDTDVSVKASTQVTLAGLQADLSSGVGAAETNDVLQCVPGVHVLRRGSQTLATAELCPKDGQT